MWYRFAIKDTPWENYIETNKTKNYDIIELWYDWAKNLLNTEMLLDIRTSFGTNQPPISVIEMVEKPSNQWLETQITQTMVFIERYNSYIEKCSKLLS
jgi:hypothetical protein